MKEKQLYYTLDTITCNTQDDIGYQFGAWQRRNHDFVIVSHSVTLIGLSYLLTIVYYDIED